MKIISGGVCAPKGFKAGGIWCGIKAKSAKRDLALIYSEKCCNAAAMFTTNRVQAAPILISRQHIAGGKLHAVIANSGNANACTGEAGLAAAKKMAELTADEFALSVSHVAVASTGVIGVPLPIAAIENSISALANSLQGDESGHAAAIEAIMTTDTAKKEISIEIDIGGMPVRIGGMVKGSGMIHPNMATMLCFLTTDAAISRELLEAGLQRAVRRSFHRVTVDGDTSTNDMALIMANGEANNAPIQRSAEYEIFANALTEACVALARGMAKDGEGASKLVTVTVSSAEDEKTAEKLAKAVASSSLVKTACFGADANWGRILCAMGYSGAEFNPELAAVSFRSSTGEIAVCSKGMPLPFSEDAAKKILSENEIEILIDAGSLSGGKATVWGCDLSYDYVKINGDYRS
ncbi:MAG: bifunctional glutamate N-acetyltransferase/amino-acid acetyltransferase ArgJ [Treponema sp.]|nr:bifunctional glutamate N-acetyltransferase/amino-acid acetyltransferase ArgJ [Treponema sp.]